MQLTRKSHLWKYLLLGVAVVLVVVTAVLPGRTPAASHRRFTSPALPDGVRYTFLYPSTLNDPFIYTFPTNDRGKYLQSLDFTEKESRLPGAAIWHRWFKPETEAVIVMVERATVKPLKSSRSEKQKWGGVEVSHTVLVDDPRAHEHFVFEHGEDFGTTSFTQHDRVVTSSFRVLLPGDLVPAP